METPLTDKFNRRVTYLRLSVTDRCNYRCVYCMPADGIHYVPHRELLSYEEIEVIVRALAEAGIRRVRVTGGEPLVRRDLPLLVERLVGVPGIEEVVLTTNAHLLEQLAGDLARAGLAAINISLDSLRRERFARITRGGDVERVLRGIEASRAAGIPKIKLNAVVVRGFNEDEILDLVRFSVERDVVCRFIEFMPIGEDTIWGSPESVVPAAEMRDVLSSEWQLEAEGTKPGKGPAKYYRLFGPGMPSWGHPVGIIAAVTECFCGDCNRIRLTAQGGLRACLADDREVNLRDVLRGGGTKEDVVAAALRSLNGKLEAHAFRLNGENVTMKQMVSIGG